MGTDFNKKITIANHVISDDSKTFIIAEAGVNHNGQMDLAKRLVDAALEAGADAVKFQAFKSNELILSSVEKANYQKKTTGSQQSQLEMLKALEISKKQISELKSYCQERGILFLITPFDEVSLGELDDLNIDAYKISSTDLTNLPFLKRVAKKGKPIILSTGMSFFSEVEEALNEISEFNQDIILLHCTANYPTPDDEVNLNVLTTYKEKFNILIGFSDHTVGIGASPYSLPYGAKVVEKHFTLDKSMEGPDQNASLDPVELKQYVDEIRRVEKFLGSRIKTPQASELNTRQSLQKCLVATKEIKCGETLTEDSFIAKRTGGKGISPINYKEVIGKKAMRNFSKNDIIEI